MSLIRLTMNHSEYFSHKLMSKNRPFLIVNCFQGQFHKCLTNSLYAPRSQKRKKDWHLECIFLRFWDLRSQKLHINMLVKSTPGYKYTLVFQLGNSTCLIFWHSGYIIIKLSLKKAKTTNFSCWWKIKLFFWSKFK